MKHRATAATVLIQHKEKELQSAKTDSERAQIKSDIERLKKLDAWKNGGTP